MLVHAPCEACPPTFLRLVSSACFLGPLPLGCSSPCPLAAGLRQRGQRSEGNECTWTVKRGSFSCGKHVWSDAFIPLFSHAIFSSQARLLKAVETNGLLQLRSFQGAKRNGKLGQPAGNIRTKVGTSRDSRKFFFRISGEKHRQDSRKSECASIAPSIGQGF